MQPAQVPLVATKLFVPRLRPERVDRARLRERLDRGRPVVLVSAPAGSGKSTLLADWVMSFPGGAAWISLEPGDDEPKRFLELLFQSLKRADAVSWVNPEELAKASMPEAARSVMTELLNQVTATGKTVAIIFDDYHVVESQRVHELTGFLVDHLSPNLRVVIATRADPPIALSRLRARDLLTEIRAHDLRFSHDEATNFLNETMKLALTEADVSELERRTEGWAVGLQMAAISIQSRGGAAGFVANFSGSNRYVIDYLTDEVLAAQPEDIRQFLIRTSVLERLCAPLCDAVTGRADSARVIESLEDANLFLIPLDENRYWYRYHHLFGTLLQHQLKRAVSEDAIRDIHRRASDWFAATGALDSAVSHAVAGGDLQRATDVVTHNSMAYLLRGDYPTVLRWLSMLPDEIVETRVDLLLNRASGRMLAFDLHGCDADVSRAEGLVDANTTAELRAAVLMVRAMMLRVTFKMDRAQELYEEAFRLLPVETPWRAILAFEIGMGFVAKGDLIAAERELESTRRETSPAMGLTRTIAQCVTAHIRNLRGDPQHAAALANEALQWSEAADPENATGQPLASNACGVLAEVYREWNDLETARRFAERGMAHGKRGFQVGLFECAKGLIRVAEAEGKWDEVEKCMEDVLRKQARAFDANWSQAVEWVYRRATFRRGQRTGSVADLDATVAAVRETGLLDGPYDVGARMLPSLYAMDGWLIAARVLIHLGRLDDAREVLVGINAWSSERDWKRNVIEASVIKAACDGDVALMAEAIDMASGPRFIRVFLDEGSAIAGLVDKAAARVRDRDFATRLLEAFGTRRVALADGLSEREVEVLQLIAGGVTNEQAAEKLFVSPKTVKKHLENIYLKLGVKGRVQAIARARELRLL